MASVVLKYRDDRDFLDSELIFSYGGKGEAVWSQCCLAVLTVSDRDHLKEIKPGTLCIKRISRSKHL